MATDEDLARQQYESTGRKKGKKHKKDGCSSTEDVNGQLLVRGLVTILMDDREWDFFRESREQFFASIKTQLL